MITLFIQIAAVFLHVPDPSMLSALSYLLPIFTADLNPKANFRAQIESLLTILWLAHFTLSYGAYIENLKRSSRYSKFGPFSRSARLSILFSIIRVDPSESRRRRLKYIAGLFFIVCCILISQLFWVCEPEPKWKDMPSPQCVLNKQVAICQLVCK
jgi:hypothetical protein